MLVEKRFLGRGKSTTVCKNVLSASVPGHRKALLEEKGLMKSFIIEEDKPNSSLKSLLCEIKVSIFSYALYQAIIFSRHFVSVTFCSACYITILEAISKA